MIEFLDYVKNNLQDFTNYDEAATRNSLIFPILQKLGWNIFIRDEVFPEFPVETKRIDLSLRVNNENKFFIEIKRCNMDLDNHQEQLLNYSFRAGVQLAALTNGITWQFFLPLKSGEWQKRQFFTIDIENQSTSEILPEFNKLLSKQSIQNNKAVEYAEDLFSRRTREEQIDINMPRAWQKILDDPTPELIDIISDKTEKICGYRPYDEKVIDFIHSLNKKQSSIEYQNNNGIIIYNDNNRDSSSEIEISADEQSNKCIKIKGVDIPIWKTNKYRYYFMKVIPLLVEIIPESELENLGDVGYINENLTTRSKEFPIMSKDESKFISNEMSYAWSFPICGYFVNKHWYKALFLAWIKYLKILQNKYGE